MLEMCTVICDYFSSPSEQHSIPAYVVVLLTPILEPHYLISMSSSAFLASHTKHAVVEPPINKRSPRTLSANTRRTVSVPYSGVLYCYMCSCNGIQAGVFFRDERG
jgi:hypothetical protein